MKYNPQRIQNILESIEPGATGAWSVDAIRTNTTYLVDVINEILMAHSVSWIDDAAKRAMEGLLASPNKFGEDDEQIVNRIAELSVKSALALKKKLNENMGSPTNGGANH